MRQRWAAPAGLDDLHQGRITWAWLAISEGLCRQRVQVQPIKLFEQRSAGDPKPPDRSLAFSWRNNSLIAAFSFGQAGEATVAQAAHCHPLYWRPLARAKAKGADPNRASRGIAYPSDIKSE